MSNRINKIIVILGPTASGKSDLTAKIARQFNGEVISADSRQVYRGMTIGTGKVPLQKYSLRQPNHNHHNYHKKMLSHKKVITEKNGFAGYYKGIPHYLLDVASPKRRFTVAQYKKLALKTIKNIQRRGKTPIICGGTGFYIDALLGNIEIPEIKPDLKLRARLEKKSTQELFKKLKKLDPVRAKAIDPKNPRRLIRALEIILKTDKAVPAVNPPQPSLKGGSNPPPLGGVRGDFSILYLGIKKSPQELKKLIHKRLLKRLKQGMIAEVKKLHDSGLSWRRLESFGLEYRWIARFLQKKISREEMISRLQKESEHYAKRQMTWFKRNKNIKWIGSPNQASSLISHFIKSSHLFFDLRNQQK